MMRDLVKKLIPEALGKEIEKALPLAEILSLHELIGEWTVRPVAFDINQN